MVVANCGISGGKINDFIPKHKKISCPWKSTQIHALSKYATFQILMTWSMRL